MRVEAVVEVPKGNRNKHETDHQRGAMWLDRELFTATRYPADYGYPLDVLVITNEPTFPGCHIWCHPIGVFWMTDEKGRDAKILAVSSWDMRVVWRNIHEVPEFMKREIQHFFDIYNDLEPGKKTGGLGWADREATEAEIALSQERSRPQHPGAAPAIKLGSESED